MKGKKKILVTGGAGYIGAHSALALWEAGYVPVILDNLSRSDESLLKGLEKLTATKPLFVRGDCTDRKTLASLFSNHPEITGVMHFAALKSVGESVRIPLTYYHNNIESLVALLEVMKDFKVADLIFSSSCTVYGEPDTIPVKESAPMKRAESPYGATKQMCERILEDAHVDGFRIISLRYFNPIGAHPSAQIGELPIGVPSNLVPYITQTAIGKRDQLIIFGNDYNTSDGTCIRDYIHVVDIAEAHVKALKHLEQSGKISSYDAFNLGTGEGVSVLDLVKRFMRSCGQTVNYSIGPRRPGDVEKTYADPTRANRDLGWKAKFTIDQALQDAWRWEQELSKTQTVGAKG
jgi:UDP-glucose 4-epimerase